MKIYTGKNGLENWLKESRITGAYRVVNNLGLISSKRLETISSISSPEDLQELGRAITLVRKTQWWHPKTIYETSKTEVGQAWLDLWI